MGAPRMPEQVALHARGPGIQVNTSKHSALIRNDIHAHKNRCPFPCSKCTECLFEYEITVRTSYDSDTAKRKRCVRYILLVLRDFAAALLATQSIIWAFTFLTFSLDGKSQSLPKIFNVSSDKSLLVYYLCGVFIFLAFIGFSFIVFMGGSSMAANDCNCNCCSHHNNFCIYIPGDCCLACPNCECGAITGAECSAECAPFALVAVALLAFIGIFVAAFAGVAFITKVTSQHLHVLQKQGLAQDFMVRDLEAAPDEEFGGGAGVQMTQHCHYTVLNTMPPEPPHASSAPRSMPEVPVHDRRMLVGLGLL